MGGALSNFKFHDGTTVASNGQERRIASVGTSPTSNPFGLALGIHVHQSVLR